MHICQNIFVSFHLHGAPFFPIQFVIISQICAHPIAKIIVFIWISQRIQPAVQLIISSSSNTMDFARGDCIDLASFFFIDVVLHSRVEWDPYPFCLRLCTGVCIFYLLNHFLFFVSRLMVLFHKLLHQIKQGHWVWFIELHRMCLSQMILQGARQVRSQELICAFLKPLQLQMLTLRTHCRPYLIFVECEKIPGKQQLLHITQRSVHLFYGVATAPILWRIKS